MIIVETGDVSQPRQGESICGDGVGIWQNGRSTLVAVLDGLGSGPAAAEATQAALDCVDRNRSKSPVSIVLHCHDAVRDTRGVVMALAHIDHEQAILTFTGVGNVGFSASTARPMQPFSQNGLVGHRLPELRTFQFACTPGDRIALYTDGVSSLFVQRGGVSALAGATPQQMADELVERYRTERDDVAVAILVIARSEN